MQVGGERLGRVGIVRVAVGQARRGAFGRGRIDTKWNGRVGTAVAGQDRCGVGGVARRGMAWYGNAGMEKPVKARGMEGSGTVGIMEARQVRMGMMRNGAERSGGSGHGTARKRRRGASR